MDQSMPLSDVVDQLTHLLQSISRDIPKVVRGNKTAAQRVRTATIRLEKVGKLFRKESLRAEKALRPKKRLKKRARR